jgi:pimeloyl-ACP methyl ester carboxylesterase
VPIIPAVAIGGQEGELPVFVSRMVQGDTNIHVASAAYPEASQLPPLLMCHGVARRWQTFVPLLPSLSVRWNVHALDFRGHGQSGRIPGKYRVADYAEDAVAVLKEMTEPAVLYGHSLGALVSVVAAAAMPDRVRAIILEDPPSPGLLATLDQTPYGAMFAAYKRVAGTLQSTTSLAKELAEVKLPDGKGEWTVRLGDVRDAATLRFMASCLKQLDPDTMSPLVDKTWLDRLDWQSCLAGVQCPALILRGEQARGGMLAPHDARVMANTMADAICIDVPGVGHNIHSQSAESNLRFVLPFLDSLTA